MHGHERDSHFLVRPFAVEWGESALI